MDATGLRAVLGEHLKRDAALHRQGRLKEIGEGFDQLDTAECHAIRVADRTVSTACNFWEAWIDERNHGFPGFRRGIEKSGIAKEAWPALAESLAETIRQGALVTDTILVSHF